MKYKSYKLSWLTLIASLLAGIFFYLGEHLLILASFFIFLTLIFILSNEKLKKSKKEILFQDFVSSYAEVFIFLGILFSTYSNTYFTYFAFFGVLLTNHLRIQYQATLIDTKGKNKIGIREMDYGGMLPRNGRLFVLILIPLIQYALRMNIIIGRYSLSFTDWIMVLFAFLTNITAIQRFFKIYAKLGK